MLGTSQQQPASPHDMKKRGLTVTPPRASRHLTVATGSSGTSVDVIDDDCVSSGWADGVSSGWAECINNGRDECINNGRASPSISSPIVHDHDSDAKLLSPPPEVQSNQRHGQRRGDEETSTGKLGERIATVRRTRSATTSSVVALLVGGGSSTASGSSDGRSTTAAAHSSSTASLDLATSSATLLPRPVAAAISSVAFYSRLSLRVAGSLTRYSVEAVKAGTRLSLGLSRDVMVASLFAAGTLLAPRSSRIAIMGRVEETPKAILGMDDEVDETCNSGDAVILQADTMKADPSGNEDPVTLTPRANDKKASLSVDAHSPPVSSPMTSTALSMTPRVADPR